MSKRKVGGQPGNKNAQKWTKEIVEKLGRDLIKWMLPDITGLIGKDGKPTGEKIDLHEKNIFFERFFIIEKGLYPQITSQLEKDFPKSFPNYIKIAREIQKIKLQEGAIFGKLNVTMSIFLLKVHHAFNDRAGEMDQIDRWVDEFREAAAIFKGEK